MLNIDVDWFPDTMVWVTDTQDWHLVKERIFIGTRIQEMFWDLVRKESKLGIKSHQKWIIYYVFFFFDILTYKRYDEVKYYNFNNPGFSGRTRHFTQVVWKSTTLVGCARCGGWGSGWYETYVVCNYRPAANIQRDNRYFRENVLPK